MVVMHRSILPLRSRRLLALFVAWASSACGKDESVQAVSPQPIAEPNSATTVDIDTMGIRAEGDGLRIVFTPLVDSANPEPNATPIPFALSNLTRAEAPARFVAKPGASFEFVTRGVAGDHFRLEEEGSYPFVIDFRAGKDGRAERVASCLELFGGAPWVTLPELQLGRRYELTLAMTNRCGVEVRVDSARTLDDAEIDVRPLVGKTFGAGAAENTPLPITVGAAGEHSTLLLVRYQERGEAAVRVTYRAR
jgi:hypothetical protein